MLQYKVQRTTAYAATTPTVPFKAKMLKFHANMATLDTPTCSTCSQRFAGSLSPKPNECLCFSSDKHATKLYSSVNNVISGSIPPLSTDQALDTHPSKDWCLHKTYIVHYSWTTSSCYLNNSFKSSQTYYITLHHWLLCRVEEHQHQLAHQCSPNIIGIWEWGYLWLNGWGICHLMGRAFIT